MKQRFIFTLLLLLAATTATAHDFEVDGIFYNIINGNEAAVTYKGSSSSNNTKRYVGNVTIPETVTYQDVTYTVTAIGRQAFDGCAKLTGVTIPNTVTIIGNQAFVFCSQLASVNIPESVTTIEVQAFGYCNSLTSITIPSSVMLIDEFAFTNCASLASITVEEGNPVYDSRDNCNAIINTEYNALLFGCKNTVIPYSVTTIASWAFAYCSDLTSVTLPNSLIYINDHAFLDCTGLTEITIPRFVTQIGNYAFAGCNGLTSVTIPKSVSSIGYNPFSSCEGLTSITVDSNNPYFDSRENCNAIIKTATNTLISGCMNSFIPNTVTAIDRAFSGCSGLTTISIPNSVTSIGDYAFEDCKGLKDVYSYITDPSKVLIGQSVFMLLSGNYTQRTLYVPAGTSAQYQAAGSWYPYFDQIVEMSGQGSEVNCDLNGDGVVNISDLNIIVNYILNH